MDTLDLFDLFFRCLFTSICVIYTYHRILDVKLPFAKCVLQYVLSIIPAALSCVVSSHAPWSRMLIQLSCCLLSNLVFCRCPVALTFFATFISHSILSGIYAIIAVFSGFVFALLPAQLQNDYVMYAIFFLVYIIQIIMMVFVFRLKRFSHGMPFLYNHEHYAYYYIISFISLIISIVVYFIPNNGYAALCGFVFYISVALQLIIWWRDSITMSYTQNRFVHDTGLLESEIERQNTELEKLHKDVERLSSIVHKDNKLIPAMEMAVSKCVTTGSADEASKLLEELHALSDERKGILLNNNAVTYREITHDTRTDAILNYFVRRSQDSGIDFKIDISSEYRNRFAEFISSLDICTILADLLENAFYAVRDCSSPAIFLAMSFEADLFTVKLFDNGCPFPKDVRKSMGSRRITSHPDDGGSGIGMVTISRLAKKNTGRLSIIEPAGVAGYTKAVAVRFSKAQGSVKCD